MSSNIINFPRWLKRLVCRFVGYYNGEEYNFKINENGELFLLKRKNKEQAPLINIIAKEYYKELSKTYPIENRKELKKLLFLDTVDSSLTSFHIFKAHEGLSSVNKWEIKESVPVSLIRLPESLLLGHSDKNKILSVTRLPEKQQIYVARNERSINSAIKSNLIKSEEMFKASIGVDTHYHVDFIAENEFPSILAYGLQKTPFNIVLQFFKFPQMKNKFTLLKEILIPFSLVYLSYLMITSLYLIIKRDSLRESIQEQSTAVTIALQAQSKYDSNLDIQNKFNKSLKDQRNVSVFWGVMVDIFPKAKFSNIRIVNNRYILRGSAENAISLLEEISKLPSVRLAQFDFPTRKSRKGDIFVISFELSLSAEDFFKLYKRDQTDDS